MAADDAILDGATRVFSLKCVDIYVTSENDQKTIRIWFKPKKDAFETYPSK